MGFAAIFCDLKNHSLSDMILGRSEASPEASPNRLEGKHLVKVVCIDLSLTYRAIVQKHLPNARIVADRFHVIRPITHHFPTCWKEQAYGFRNFNN